MPLCRDCLRQAEPHRKLNKDEGVVFGEICDRCGYAGGMGYIDDYESYRPTPKLELEAAIKFHIETSHKKIEKSQQKFLKECKKLLKRRI
jgi:hypothetical protein